MNKKTKAKPAQLPKEDRAFCEKQITLAILYYGADVCLPLCHGLTGGDFYDPEGQRVIDTATQLKQAGRPSDGVAIAEVAKVSGDTADQVATFSPIPEHCEYYAQRVKSFSVCDKLRKEVMPLLHAGDATGAQSILAEILPSLTNSHADALSASDWLGQQDEQEQPAIKEHFDKGDRIAIVAQSKSKKSFFALQMAVCFATGKPFLSAQVTPQKTLIVNGEIKPQKYKHRLRGIIKRLSIGNDSLENLGVLNTRESGRRETIDSILRECTRGGFEVCILDPFYIFCGNEIDQEAVKAVLCELKLFTEKKITLVSVFHSAKGNIGDRQTIDRISGSSIFARDADGIISLAVHEDGQSVVMECILRNYPEQPKQTIVFDDGAFVVSDALPVERTSKSRPVRTFDLQQVASSLSAPMTYTRAVKAIKEDSHCGLNKAKLLLADAVSKGMVKKTSDDFGKVHYRFNEV
jgi:hypothetical protein